MDRRKTTVENMTFAEFLNKLATEYKSPEIGDADRNGNTRLAVLQYRYGLSSLKIQKLLITSGVFEPVKQASNYYAVRKMANAGKNAKEIVEATGLSTAAVNAFLPYKKGAMNLDKLGVKISNDAARKRKQRGIEEMKRNEAVAALGQHVSDDRFWVALSEHSGESFYATTGEKYTIRLGFAVPADPGSKAGEVLKVTTEKEENVFTKEEVEAVLHNALEASAANLLGISKEMLEQTPALPYVYPILSVFRIIDDDPKNYQVRRNAVTHIICSCCGRRTDQLFTVRSYADLKRLQDAFEQERRAAMPEVEREEMEQAEAAYRANYKYENGKTVEEEIKEQERRAAGSQAVAEFNGEERHLCKLCAETIRMALDLGDMPSVHMPIDYTILPMSMLEEEFEKSLIEVDRAIDKGGRVYDSECFYASHGHLFALSCCDGGDNLFLHAIEVHKLTKAGKVAVGSTGTDYEVMHYVRIDGLGGKEKLVGLLELEKKIEDTLTNPSLEKHNLRNVGTIVPVYLGDECGEYGFMVDGKEYTGDQLAKLFSHAEGWHVHYQIDDSFDPVLTHGEYLMPVRLGKNELADETMELIGMFTKNGRFISDHDAVNFTKLFDGVLQKLKLYHESNPRGYGKLAGMEIIKRLAWIEGTDEYQEKVREIIR